MAWDFSTDPELEGGGRWIREFRSQQIGSARPALSEARLTIPSKATSSAYVRSLQQQVRDRGLWAAHLGPELGVLEVAVLERDGDLVGERLEQEQVVVAENDVPSVSRLATTIDPISPDSPRSGPTMALRSGINPDEATMEEARRAWATRAVEASGRPAAAGPSSSARGLLASRWKASVPFVARPQEHLGELGAEHGPGVVQKRRQRGVQLRRVLEDAGRLVQELEALVLLAFGQVRAIARNTMTSGTRGATGAAGRAAAPTRPAAPGSCSRTRPGPELDHLRQLLVLRGAADMEITRGDRQRAQAAAVVVAAKRPASRPGPGRRRVAGAGRRSSRAAAAANSEVGRG